MSWMFSNCHSLISLPDIYKWFTTNDIYLFNNCISLLNITGIKESKKIDINDDDSEDSHINDDKYKYNRIIEYESEEKNKLYFAMILKEDNN